MTDLEKRLHAIRYCLRERWAGDGEAFMDALREAACIGAEVEREACAALAYEHGERAAWLIRSRRNQ